MITNCICVNNLEDDEYNKIILNAANIIKLGGLVAFPTETVYGLGANAYDNNACNKIYTAKGRPSDNPLIVHIANIKELYNIALCVNQKAKILIDNFWPGPLTLIFKKTSKIPYETSGGLDTVAVRFPSHKVATDLITLSGVPIAAPSANLSGRPSPTAANHVKFDLDGKINMILDGGQASFGIESTIIDVSTENVCLLRPGSITIDMICPLIGDVTIDESILKQDVNLKPKAPGMRYSHYSPLAKVTIISGKLVDVVSKINTLVDLVDENNIKIGVLATEQTKDFYDNKKCFVQILGDRNNPQTMAKNLFETLRKFDYNNVQVVYVEAIDEDGLGLSIMNRLKKASGYDIINI